MGLLLDNNDDDDDDIIIIIIILLSNPRSLNSRHYIAWGGGVRKMKDNNTEK